jgi:hypothetical protein
MYNNDQNAIFNYLHKNKRQYQRRKSKQLNDDDYMMGHHIISGRVNKRRE